MTADRFAALRAALDKYEENPIHNEDDYTSLIAQCSDLTTIRSLLDAAEERDDYLHTLNLICKVSGSKTHGGLAGHVGQLRIRAERAEAERDRLCLLIDGYQASSDWAIKWIAESLGIESGETEPGALEYYADQVGKHIEPLRVERDALKAERDRLAAMLLRMMEKCKAANDWHTFDIVLTEARAVLAEVGEGT